MAAGKFRWIRIPLALLAIGDLVLLASRLQPWSEIGSLPGQGTTGYDPAISLVAYLFLVLWIGGIRNSKVQSSLAVSVLLAIPAGVLAIAAVCLPDFHLQNELSIQIGLLAVAAILWGVAGMRGAKLAGSPNVGIVAGLWSAMVSALMASAVILARINLANPAPASSDPWKQYQGLAIGNQAMQVLVDSLNTTTGFLLIAPLVGGALGLVFAMAAQK